MKQSTHRILTTHTGSLPRPTDVQQMLEAQDRGEQIDREAFYEGPHHRDIALTQTIMFWPFLGKEHDHGN